MSKYGKAAALFAAAVLLLLNIVVPPFQNPDEPQHFTVAVFHARGEGARADVESGVIRMMDRADWWRLLGIGRPQPLPKSLSEIEFLMEGMGDSVDFRDRLKRFELWHLLTGKALRPVAGWSLERLYYLSRAGSSILLIGALFLLWKTFELLAAAFGRIVLWGFGFVFFLPQLWLTGTSVSPDAAIMLISAAFFYGAAAILVGKKGKAGGKTVFGLGWTRAGRLALVIVLPIVGLLMDRSAFVLVPLALLTILLTIRRENVQVVVPWMLIGAIGAILAAYFAALRYPFEAESIVLSVNAAAGGVGKSFSGILDIAGFARTFWGFVVDGFLLKFGWLVFGPPKAIYWVWRILIIAAGAGMVVRFVKWAKARMKDERESGEKTEGMGGERTGSSQGRWFVLAVAASGAQMLGMWLFYGTAGVLGQGRYLFPVIAPIAFLLVLGLNEIGDIIKRGLGRKVLAGLILGELLLLVIAIWALIVPAFHLILLGPHPGV